MLWLRADGILDEIRYNNNSRQTVAEQAYPQPRRKPQTPCISATCLSTKGDSGKSKVFHTDLQTFKVKAFVTTSV